MKQIGLALMQYSQDYDERLPIYSSNSIMWAQRVDPYIKNTQVWNCPSGGYTPCSTATCNRTLMCNFSGGTASYFYNNFYSVAWTTYNGLSSRKLGEINKPAETIITGDASCAVVDQPTNIDAINNRTWPGNTRHNDGGNVAFCDGHAKWLKAGNFTAAMFRYDQ